MLSGRWGLHLFDGLFVDFVDSVQVGSVALLDAFEVDGVAVHGLIVNRLLVLGYTLVAIHLIQQSLLLVHRGGVVLHLRGGGSLSR